MAIAVTWSTNAQFSFGHTTFEPLVRGVDAIPESAFTRRDALRIQGASEPTTHQDLV